MRICLFLSFMISLASGLQVSAQSLSSLVVNGVKQPVIILNGTWQFKAEASSEQLNNTGKWHDITVPGEPAMQGFKVKFDEPMVYQKSVDIPADFKGKQILLRFDGVYSYARLWVNGKYMQEHYGGFTRWESDITAMVSPGKQCTITLEVTDKQDDISFASGYAKHCIGGILRDVTLYALPHNRISNMTIDTELDAAYTDGKLKLNIWGQVKDKAIAKFSLTDPAGKPVHVTNPQIELINSNTGQQYSIAVKNPLKWDAEHPNLYSLKVGLWVNGKQQYEFSQEIGFREVVIKGNELFVNGRPVKLRGACRHDMHPLLGRVATAKYDKLDVELAKEANVNFIRTSHYPPTERFVEYCNKAGIYLEAETAVCFVNEQRPTQDSAIFTKRYLSQLKEMVSALRNEPSVIIWSIGNESFYGTNFQASYNWVKKNDKSRPVILSWPGKVPKEKKAYDLLSMHYPSYAGDVWPQVGAAGINGFTYDSMPVIFDEWAHVACYTNNVLKEDPNIREFWGQSLDRMWQGVFDAKGGLGGAIWGMIDETFMLPDTIVGYGEWGIIDTWRRKKPEFWSTRKAYSPVRVLKTNIQDFTPSQLLQIPIHNRFDHTWLNEVQLNYTYNGKTKSMSCPNIPPHNKGFIALPAANWAPGDAILLKFSRNNVTLDEYALTLGKKPLQKETLIPAGDVKVAETADSIFVQGRNFRFPFSKNNGLLSNAVFNGKPVLRAGPYLNFSATGLNENIEQVWKLKKIAYSSAAGMATIFIEGRVNDMAVQFKVRTNGNGDMAVDYSIDNVPSGLMVKESGVKFILPESVNRLQWEREPYWSYYSEGHFGAAKGNVSLYAATQVIYRAEPVAGWQFDDKSFYYFGLQGNRDEHPFTNMAKTTKENIYSYRLSGPQGAVVEVVSKEAGVACRVNRDKNQQITLYANTLWDYPDIGWGDYSKNIKAKPHKGVIYFKMN